MNKEKRRNLLGTFIVAALAYIVLGLFMVIYPKNVADGIRIVFGIAMLVYGAINIISFFLNQDSEENLFLELAMGVIGAGLGIFALVPTDFISRIIMYTIGAVLIIDGLVNAKRAMNLKARQYSRWYFFLIAAVLGIVLGIVSIVLYSTMHEAIRETIVIFIGISLIYEGVASLATIFIDRRVKKKIAKELSRLDNRD